jgi:hypothetical protein
MAKAELGRAKPPSVLPEPIKAVGAQLGIPHRVHNVAVSHEVLQRAGIDAVIRQLEPTGVAQHVRMNWEGEFGQFPGAADHFEEPGPSHRPGDFGPRGRASVRRPPPYNGGQLPSGPCSELLAARS